MQFGVSFKYQKYDEKAICTSHKMLRTQTHLENTVFAGQ